jgi:hypothetical protein
MMSQQTRGLTNPIASQMQSNQYAPDSRGFASNYNSSAAQGRRPYKSVRPDVGRYESQMAARYNPGQAVRQNILSQQGKDILSNQTPAKQFTSTGGKHNFMHLRQKNNRTGMYSVDRNRVANKANRMFPETAASANRPAVNYGTNSKYQYNTSSISYINKGQGIAQIGGQ